MRLRRSYVSLKTVLGLIGAAMLALLGFFLPGAILRGHVESTLSETYTVAVEAPPDVQLTLARADYGDVLLRWYTQSDGVLANGMTREYHEPVGEQIGMDAAIDAAIDAAQVFCEWGVFPMARTGRLYSTGAVLYNSPSPENVRDYRDSFWDVTLTNDDCVISMQINAVTAQVWDVYAFFRTPYYYEWAFEEQIKRLYAYADYLNCDMDLIEESYEYLYDERTMHFFLQKEPFDLLSECFDVDDGNQVSLHLRMVPKGYTFDDLMQEYNRKGMNHIYEENYDATDDYIKFSATF